MKVTCTLALRVNCCNALFVNVGFSSFCYFCCFWMFLFQGFLTWEISKWLEAFDKKTPMVIDYSRKKLNFIFQIIDYILSDIVTWKQLKNIPRSQRSHSFHFQLFVSSLVQKLFFEYCGIDYFVILSSNNSSSADELHRKSLICIEREKVPILSILYDMTYVVNINILTDKCSVLEVQGKVYLLNRIWIVNRCCDDLEFF